MFLCEVLAQPALSGRVGPRGASSPFRSFSSRQRWGRQVAYNSQFLDRDNRAHRGQARINSKLCSIGGFDPDAWDLPPKPKWMRWRTYNRAVEKFDRYEAVLDAETLALVAKLKRFI